MRFRILPYKQGSRSARSLSTALQGKVLRLEGSSYVPRVDDVVINWGRTVLGTVTPTLNLPDAIQQASNKLTFFQMMKDRNFNQIPKFWTNQEDIPYESFPIVCRSILTGHSGAGIHIAHTPSDLVEAPLYVKYVKKKNEYRIHLGCERRPDGNVTTVIATQRKARKLGHDNPNWEVRNLAGGFIYQREGFTVPSKVLDAAIECMEATDLHFGAIDVIYNEHEDKAYVLEVNTAPGLVGTTVQDYANYFKEIV